MQYQYNTETVGLRGPSLRENCSLIADDQLSTCIFQADAHYPAQLAASACITPGTSSMLRDQCISILRSGTYVPY